MKNLKLKLTIIGISLLSINVFSQDYIYKGVKNVDATIGMNKNESDSGQETVSENCYDPANIGKTIQAKGCAGLKIVDNTMLRNLVETDGNYADTAIFTGQVTDMSYLFCSLTSSAYPDCTLKNPSYSILNWNVSNVTDMRYMFASSSYNQPLNNWDVSSVTNMSHMFYGSSYNQPLDNWNVSNVTKTNAMFMHSTYNQPLNNWNVSNVTNMSNMFRSSAYNQPLDNWNVSNVTNMYSMFRNASYFNQDISGWCVINISSEPSSFSTGSPLLSSNKPLWNNCPQ